MKRFSVRAAVISVLAIACALALAACGGQSSSSSSASTQEKPKIVVGYDKSNYGTGEGQGFEDSATYKTTIKPAIENLGWEAEFKGIEFADIEKSINDGTIDCYWNSYTIQGRENLFAWSEAYQKATPAIVFKKADGLFGDTDQFVDITAISDRPSNKVIAVKAGTMTYADMSADQKAIVDTIGTLKEYPDLTQCKAALDKGEVDMVLTEVQILSPLFADYATYGRAVFLSGDTNSYGAAFKKGNEEKANAVTDALRKVYTSGKLKEDFLAYFKSQGLSDANAEQAWNNIDSGWLLKDKVIVGYASDNYGTGEGQGFTDGTDYKHFIKDTLKNLNWEIEFKGIPYADIEKSINDGTIDCFWDNYTIQGREDKFAWSDAYKKARPVIVFKRANGDFDVAQNGEDITSVANLPSNKTIAVKAGSVTYADLPADQKALVDSIGTLKEYPGLAQCKDALDKGEVDMVLTEMAIASPLFDDYVTYGRVTFIPSETNTYGVAFKKGSEAKAKALSEALKDVYASGTLKNNYISYIQGYVQDNAVIEYLWDDTYGQSWLLK